jgi:hypothetical protein
MLNMHDERNVPARLMDVELVTHADLGVQGKLRIPAFGVCNKKHWMPATAAECVHKKPVGPRQ